VPTRTDESAGNSPLAILVINPGSMSTKLAMFRDLEQAEVFEIEWKLRQGLRGKAIEEEVDRYFSHIQQFLTSIRMKPDAVAGRGGFIDRSHQKIASGVYRVAVVQNGRAEICEDIYRGVTEAPELDHASNYGIPVAARVALAYNIPAFTVDPVVVDDFQELARFSGYAPVERRSLAHVLSIRAMGRKAAAQLGEDFFKVKMVAVHLGGGISVAALRDGRIVDTNNAMLGGGPFSPQRVGSMPMRDLIDLCYSGRFTKQELQIELTRRGGLMSYLGEDDFPHIETRIAQGDKRAEMVVHAMAYQVAKEIGAMAIAAGGVIAAVVFSGGLSRSEMLLGCLRPRVEHLAPVIVFPGSLEMEAMAHGAYRVMKGEEEAITYKLN
jgi:butyrate kinase